MSDFRGLLDECIAYYGGKKQDFAQALGIRPSILSKLRRGGMQPSTDLCLRLALICHRPPTDVLRAADRYHTALLIESLFGARATRRFTGPASTPHEREFFKLWQQLRPDEERALALILTRTLAGRTHPHRRASAPTLKRRAS